MESKSKNPDVALNVDDDSDDEEIDELLLNNQDYVEEVNQRHPEFFKSLGAVHKPKYLMVGCVDARIQPGTLLKLNPGEVFIHRNIANQFNQGDMNANAVLQYAIEGLNIKRIIVLGHSRCGGIIASMKEIPFAVVDQWISNIRDMYDTHLKFFEGIPDEIERAAALAKVNVRLQCINIRKSAVVQKALQEGKDIHIYGLYYDVTTGEIENLHFNNKYIEGVSEMYSEALTGILKFVETQPISGLVEGQTQSTLQRQQSLRCGSSLSCHTPKVKDPMTGMFVPGCGHEN